MKKMLVPTIPHHLFYHRENRNKENSYDYTCSFNFRARLNFERVMQAQESKVELSCDMALIPGQANLGLFLVPPRSSQLGANLSIWLDSMAICPWMLPYVTNKQK